MEKTILTAFAVFATLTASAKVLRVSNVNGSTAPYSSIQAAHDAAETGDTIMVDGSTNKYDKTIIEKSLVIIGPGFWVNENGLSLVNVPSAIAEFEIRRTAPGTVIEGFYFKNVWGAVVIMADDCIVRRCYFYDHSGYKAIIFSRDYENNDPDPSGAIIHQNFFADCVIFTRFLTGLMTNVQITNNIFVKNAGTEYEIRGIGDSYIAYNTMIGSDWAYTPFADVYTSNIQHNIIRLIKDSDDNYKKIWYPNIGIEDDNEWSDNVELPYSTKDIEYATDLDIKDYWLTTSEVNDYGAFAGDSPYVISGIPAAAVIEDVVVPTSVEAGSKMSVTLKVGVQK